MKPVVVMLKCPRTEIGPSGESPLSLPRSPAIDVVIVFVFVFVFVFDIIMFFPNHRR